MLCGHGGQREPGGGEGGEVVWIECRAALAGVTVGGEAIGEDSNGSDDGGDVITAGVAFEGGRG